MHSATQCHMAVLYSAKQGYAEVYYTRVYTTMQGYTVIYGIPGLDRAIQDYVGVYRAI